MALSHAKLQSFLAPYLLKALEPREVELVRRHLQKGCPSCAAILEGLRPGLSVLADTLSEVRPSANLREKLSRALKAEPIEVTRREGILRYESGVLETRANGRAELRVKGEALVAAQPKSLLRLWRGAKGLQLYLEKGAAMIQIKSGTPFFAELPLGALAVRGTVFFLESRGAKDSYLCLCEGRIRLEAPGLKTELFSQDHLGMTLHRSGSRTLSRPASGIHAEPELSEFD